MSGPGDKVAEAIMMLMQQGGRRGMPMEASPELQAYLQSVQGSTPDAASFDSMNVDLLPGSPAGEFVPEHPVPISQDPWFDQGAQSPQADQMRQLMQEIMGGPTPGAQSSPGGGTWYLKIRDSRGNLARADGPFASELEAHRARQAYAKETGRDPSRFIVEQDGV